MYWPFFAPFFREKRAFVGALATGAYRGAGLANRVYNVDKTRKHGIEAKNAYQAIKKMPVS